jgi:hypothetical protein
MVGGESLDASLFFYKRWEFSSYRDDKRRDVSSCWIHLDLEPRDGMTGVN